MKIDELRVSNFRGIKDVELSSLGTMVIVAGQNGSGKSWIFDAIRLLKSVYGGYQQNEWQQWLGEFQIQMTNRASDFWSVHRAAPAIAWAAIITLGYYDLGPLSSFGKRIINKHTLGFCHGIIQHFTTSKFDWSLRALRQRQLAPPYLPTYE